MIPGLRPLSVVPVLVVALAYGAPRAYAQGESQGSMVAGAEDPEAWAERQLSRLTLQEKVGQLFMPWIGGDYMAVGGEAYERLREWVADHGVGGVIMSIGAPLDVASKLNLLQELADLPLLVAADMERGPGQRLTGGVALPWGLVLGGGTSFPPLMALGAAGDESLAYDLGRITALEGRAAGVHMTFAPVADVNNNPANPIINTRSYGESPAAVARLVAAHVRGLQEHGMLATAKHFPGHGDTEVDSHIELPVIHVDRARADTLELVPFRAAVAADVSAVMSAHIAFPAITGDSSAATLSPSIMTGLLRDELGFEGLIVTDALDMGAIIERYGDAEAAVLSLEAGADILLMPLNLTAAIDGVLEAVESGRVSEARVDESVRKLLVAKAGLGLHQERKVQLDAVPHVVANPDHIARAEEAAARGLTLVRDESGVLPINRSPDANHLSIVYSDQLDLVTGRTFQRALAQRLPGLQTAALDARSGPDELAAMRAAARQADVVFFSPFVSVRAWKGHAAVAEPVAELIQELARERPVVVTSFGNPYLLLQFPEVSTYLLAWGEEDAVQRAAARALAGESAVTGRLPISLPPYHEMGEGLTINPAVAEAATPDALPPAVDPGTVPQPGDPGTVTEAGDPPTVLPPPHSGTVPASAGRDSLLRLVSPREVGMDSDALREVDAIIEAAVAGGVTPGAAIAVGRSDGVVLLRGYGRLDRRPGFGPATDSAVYDLASLTKVVGTTSAVMLLEESGLIDLDAPVSRYLPEWDASGHRSRVTVRHLLTHTSGLPAYGPLWRELRGRDRFLERLASMPLERPPASRVVYSDYGMIILALLAERVAGEPLDRLLERELFGRLGMRDTGYNPVGPPPEPESLREVVLDAVLSGEAEADAVAGVEILDAAATHDAGRASALARIAPTEIDRSMRGVHVHGYVHDENAYAIGGVAGHAGIFSSARDLAVYARMLLRGGEAGGVRVLEPATVQRYVARQAGAGSRALGWDTPVPSSSAGDYFSARSFGHTGFTGTSIWIDPDRDVFVVLLTNRVNPTREQQGHIPLRRAVHDAVQRAIVDRPVRPRADAART